MSEHWLKTSSEFFSDVVSGIKPFEIRIDDRLPRYESGDTLHLQEYANNEYTGHEITVKATYVLRDERFCKDGFCVIGIRRAEPKARMLTVEELSTRINKPIWIDWCSKYRPDKRNGWEIITNIQEDIVYVRGGEHCYLIEDYDKTWLAYDRQPEEGAKG